MWKLLPWIGRGASGYPQRECFFCRTTSIILPPYRPDAGNGDAAFSNGHSGPSNIASSSTSIISTGTPTNWFCSSCHCQNVAKEDGTPVEQYTRPMWDEEWNRNRSQLVRHTRPTPSNRDKLLNPSSLTSTPLLDSAFKKVSFQFCHTCQTNQILTMNMLADYLPSEDDPEYQDKLNHLPEYQASIAARYPSVCADCAPKVQERIAERDQFARSWSLGRWLDLKKKISAVDADANPVHSSGSPRVKAADPHSTVPRSADSIRSGSAPQNKAPTILGCHDNGSVFSMALFVLINTSIWAFYLWICLQPHQAAAFLSSMGGHVQAEPSSLMAAALLSLRRVCMPWLLIRCCNVEPLKRSIEKARARQIRIQVSGAQLWSVTQRLILHVRALLLLCTIGTLAPEKMTSMLRWVETATHKEAIELLWLAAATLLICEISLTVFAASQLKIRSPSPLQLVSKPIIANGTNGQFADVGADPLLTSLSLDEQAVGPLPVFSQAKDFDARPESSRLDHGFTPAITRDADGDAVMEDAQAYSARRMSMGSDEDWEHTSPQLAPQPHWVKAPQSFGLAPSSSTVPTAPRRSDAYRDFQLGPQRFWEPQAPTGLEDVFGRAVSLDDGPQRNADETSADRKWSKWFGFSK